MNTIEIEAILRERISNWQLQPGTKLRELPLATEFGVDRAKIRAAFIALERRGLIERVPNQGAVVKIFTASDYMKLYDVFEMLEGLCARLAAQNAPPGAWTHLIDLFGDELETAVKNNDCESLFNAIMEYRASTIAAADNPTLTGFLESIYEKTLFLIKRTLILPGRAAQSFQEHKEIIRALDARDPVLAEALKRENMRSARILIEKYIDFVF